MPEANVTEAARAMGWKPQEEFRGDTSKWVDAETFVSRGEHYLPIIKADRDRAQAAAEDLRTRLDETNRLLAASQEAITELKKFHDEDTQRQVEKARKDLVKQLREAREAGDVEGEVAAQSEITKIDVALAAPPKPVVVAPAPAPVAAVDPAFTAWEAANPWFRTDTRKHALAMSIGAELRADPKNAALVGRAFYDKITEEVEAYLAPTSREHSKVAGGRPSNGGGGGGATCTYSDLPADAKAACDSFARKLVGPSRAFKNAAAWQAHYTAKYFEGESA
jgi:hypothetical protein